MIMFFTNKSKFTIIAALIVLATLVFGNTNRAQARALGAQGEYFLYQIEPGDTLEQLSNTYTLTRANWRLLQELNAVDDTLALPIGKVIRIPLALIPVLDADAQVVHVQGQVLIDGKPLKAQTQALAGQAVSSGPNGATTLRLQDGSLLSIPPNTQIQLQRLKAFEGNGLTDTIIVVDQGRLESDVAPADTGVGRFEVRSPATVTGVRGTRLRVQSDSRGTRHEVVSGRAAVADQTAQEQVIAANQGAAYDTGGSFLGLGTMLPAPRLQPAPDKAVAALQLEFEPITNATAYRVRVTHDAAGSLLETEQIIDSPKALIGASGHGQRYVFVRAIDPLGIEGNDANVAVRFLAGLLSSNGQPVLSSSGQPVRLSF